MKPLSSNALNTGLLALATSIGAATLTTPALAERIKIPVGQQHQDLKHLARPTRGQSMASVQQRFGEPVQRYAARGEPPISRWEYPGFMVYFEHSHVIHSVIKHRPVNGE